MVKEQGKCLIAAWFLFILYFSAVTPRACFQRPYIFLGPIEVLSFVSPSTPFIVVRPTHTFLYCFLEM